MTIVNESDEIFEEKCVNTQIGNILKFSGYFKDVEERENFYWFFSARKKEEKKMWEEKKSQHQRPLKKKLHKRSVIQ